MTTHIVIIGCGFGGLEATRSLANEPVKITLIDRSNHHLFQPLLYQVATAGLSAPLIAAPIRHILRKQKNAIVLLAEVKSIDAAGHRVILDDDTAVTYDQLIVAPGATHSYFGRDDWERHAPGLKTLDDAYEIRRRILLAFERAERETRPSWREAWLTFAVVGAGPTGVELAGAMAEIAHHTLSDEFRRIDTRRARIILVEGTDRVLPNYAEDLSEKARQQLERLGVVIYTGYRVTEIDDKGLWLNEDGEKQRLDARTIIWAAGVAASPLGKSLGVPLDRAGRVLVQPDLSVPNHPDVFVVGDLAAATSDGKPVPGVSPAAKQMGRQAADNVLRRMRGETTRPFRYRDYGSLATIGRRAAVVMVGPFKFSGLLAWLFWLFVHIYFLIGFRNRLVVFTDWAVAYVTFERYARIFSNRTVKSDCEPPST
ncbi:MAG TPA: NAD(P)/FAD-dependent oxidoreductase [Burkholderiales bacterium]|nr:NAD(P)/FAD-dependent oxidoreductase [Burkholderiales bacterium]